MVAMLGAALAAAPAVGQVPDDDPRVNLVVRVGERFVRTVPGDYCLEQRADDGRVEGSGCSDTDVDVRKLPRVAVSAGGQLELRPRAAASQVRVWAGRAGPSGAAVEIARRDARRVGPTGTRWRVRLPSRCATHVRILVRYGRATQYSVFFIGVRVRR